nr:hypothetical protein BaRGS_004879 [Batillaria attramentaria]
MGKKYGSDDEEALRYRVFMENLKRIEMHNWEYFNMKKSYYLDINQFADLTFDEYKQYNKLMVRPANKNSSSQTFLPPLNWEAPESVDWRTKGYVTPVKNQGQCGSCWSFSTTGSLEGQHFRATGKLVSLSEQQLVDCSGSFGNNGCHGGIMDQAFAYINNVGGIESEEEYPYMAVEGTCQFKKSEVVADLTGYNDIESGNEKSLKEAVASQGVYDEPECSSIHLDHGVLVVGYGSEKGQDFWLVKNSWDTTWGEQGYIKMTRNNNNQCGIATDASYPVVKSTVG